ncbi:unnamed protein product [Caenorhabditis nigoni]
MVLGAGSVSLELSNWALRSIEALKFEDVFAKMEKIRREKNEERAQCEEFKRAPFQKWTMDQGKERFRQFLSQVKNASGVCEFGQDKNGCLENQFPQ